jgi:multiple sugar transport system ATP-binding protein
LRGEVFGAEYLGTTQIVTIDTAHGQVKARIPSDQPVRVGEKVGLDLRGDRLTLFDAGSGRAVKSALYAEAGHG